MPRPRRDLSKVQEQKLLDLMSRGGTVETNTAALQAAGINISKATVGRRMRELQGKVREMRAERVAALQAVSKLEPTPEPKKPKKKKGKASKAELEVEAIAAAMPATPADIPDHVDSSTLDRWIETANRMGLIAEEDGDLDSLAKMGRLTASLLEHKRKAAPPPKHDPNDDPDMVKLGADVALRLHNLIERVAS